MSIARPSWIDSVERQITEKADERLAVAVEQTLTARRAAVPTSAPPVEYGGAAADPGVPVSQGGSYAPGITTGEWTRASTPSNRAWLWLGIGLISAAGVGLVAWYAMQPKRARRRRR